MLSYLSVNISLSFLHLLGHSHIWLLSNMKFTNKFQFWLKLNNVNYNLCEDLRLFLLESWMSVAK